MNKLLVFFVLFSGSAFASGGNINVKEQQIRPNDLSDL
jgi:hypothetical protein